MKKWILRKDHGFTKDNFDNNSDISIVLAKLLANRNINHEQVNSFLYPNEDVLHDPFMMKDLEEAVDIIIEAIDSEVHIRIVGDYDQDGNSATVVLYKALEYFTDNISFAIPHRVEDGYGISKGIIDTAKEDGVGLIITCDNGVSALEVVDYSNEVGIPVIVTDHHEVMIGDDGVQILPNALAVVNPHRQDCNYPFEDLCGAGVAFKVMQGLYTVLGGDEDYLMDLLQFACMGTVCDVVNLLDENRYIVKKGLEILNRTDNIGVLRLKEHAKINGKINVTSLGFKIGPCINASGRLDSAVLGVKLFLEEDEEAADFYAKELVDLNEMRKEMTTTAYENVKRKIIENKYYDSDVIVVYEPTIHESIAGIVAGRVKDFYYRPTLVVTKSKEDGILKGSARSVEGYNVVEGLRKCSDLFEKFGGHTMAAGFSIKEENLDKLRDSLNSNSTMEEKDFVEKIKIDCELDFKFVNFDIVSELKLLEPCGKANPEAIFGAKNVEIKKISVIGKNKNVFKFIFKQGDVEFPAIVFSSFEKYMEFFENRFKEENIELKYDFVYEKGVKIDILYTPIINEYMNTKSIQLLVSDVR